MSITILSMRRREDYCLLSSLKVNALNFSLLVVKLALSFCSYSFKIMRFPSTPFFKGIFILLLFNEWILDFLFLPQSV